MWRFIVRSGARPPAAAAAPTLASRQRAPACFHSLATCSRAHTPSCMRTSMVRASASASSAPRAFSSAAEGENDNEEEGEEEEEEEVEEEGGEEGGEDAAGDGKKKIGWSPAAARAPLGSARPADQRHMRSIVHLDEDDGAAPPIISSAPNAGTKRKADGDGPSSLEHPAPAPREPAQSAKKREKKTAARLATRPPSTPTPTATVPPAVPVAAVRREEHIDDEDSDFVSKPTSVPRSRATAPASASASAPLPSASEVDSIMDADKRDAAFMQQERFVDALAADSSSSDASRTQRSVGSSLAFPTIRGRRHNQRVASGAPREDSRFSTPKHSSAASPYATPHYTAAAAGPAAEPAPSAPAAAGDLFNSSFNSFAPNSTFVSSHYRIDPAQVLRYISDRKHLSFVRSGLDRITIRDCPFCKNIKGKSDNQYKLTIWLDTGSHNCLRCGAKGSWFDFKKNLGDIPIVTNVMGGKMDGSHVYSGPTQARTSSAAPSASSHPTSAAAAAAAKLATPLPNQSIVHTYPSNLFTQPKYAPVLSYLLNDRGLTRETLRFYQIGACTHKFPNHKAAGGDVPVFEEQLCVTMPWIKTRKQIEQMKSQMDAPTDKEIEKEARAKKKVAREKAKVAATAHTHATIDLHPNAATSTPLPDQQVAAAGVEQPASADAPSHGGVTPAAATNAADQSTTSATPAPSSSSSDSSFVSPSSDDQVTERIKLRSLVAKGNQRLQPPGGAWNFFGWHTVPADADEIVLTEGEFDAMAVWQATGMPAVSLPNGARSLPVELLPLLERFSKIYLWLDDDAAGAEGADKFARKLGVGRCVIVKSSLPQRRIEQHEDDVNDPTAADDHAAAAVAAAAAAHPKKPPPKDANDALRQGADLHALIAAAEPVKHEQILQFRDLRSEVLREFTDPLARRGVQSRYLPSLNKLLKGHRPGELTIVTGATGVGKTTVLSQISLDYCSQGVNTLWGSFEIRNTKLARTMISQYANMNFSTEIPAPTHASAPSAGGHSSGHPVDVDSTTDSSGAAVADGSMDLSEPLVAQPQVSPPPDPAMLASFNQWADRFEQLPLYFMKFFGSNSVESVLDAMEYAVYVYDVEHILLDNLQFMLSEQGRGYDRFELQDRAISLFREFASAKNVHITLVIHPRKENDSQVLGVSSIFGGAKATQEADNILIIQKPNVIDENTMLTSGGGLDALRSEIVRLKAEAEAAKHDGFNIHEHRRIEIKKNRFDGELGVIPFTYNRKTCRIHEISPHGHKKKMHEGGGQGQGQGRSPPPAPAPAPPREPRRTRADFYRPTNGGGGDDSAQAVANANAKAEASMMPKQTVQRTSPERPKKAKLPPKAQPGTVTAAPVELVAE